jgi:kynurenine formamidase
MTTAPCAVSFPVSAARTKTSQLETRRGHLFRAAKFKTSPPQFCNKTSALLRSCFNSGEPGLGVEGAKYLTGKGVVAIGADTWGLEVIPFESKNVFEVHQILLPMNGTYIMEVLNTADLASDKAYEFLFVLGQPRFKGGVQSMINPVAIR